MTARPRTFILILLTLLLYPLLAGAQANAQVTPLPGTITSTDGGVVSLQFIARQPDGYGVIDLNPGAITLSEPSNNLTVTASPDLNLSLAIIVDLSVGSDVGLIQGTLRAYFNDYYRDGDRVTLYILDTQTYNPRIIEVATRADALAVVNGLNSAGRFYLLPQTLEQVLADMLALGNAPSRPRHVLYVTSYMTAPRDAALSAPFAEANIPFHAVQAYRTRDVTPVRQFAENGNGLYANNINGTLVLNENTAINALKVLYDTIAASRNVFTLTYQSLNPSLEATRTVTLEVALTSDIIGRAQFSYERGFQPLAIRFANNNDLAANRQPLRPNNDATLTYDRDVQPVRVEITFPDGTPRPLASVRLQVTNEATGQVQQSTLQQNPLLNERNTLTLEWLLDEYTTPDTTTPVQLSVTVVDALGTRTTATAAGRVSVTAAPPLPTRTPTPTPLSEAALAEQAATRAPIAVIAVGSDGEPILVDGEPLVLDGSSSGLSNTTVTYLAVAIGVLVLLVVAVLARLINVSSAFAAAGPPPTPKPEPATNPAEHPKEEPTGVIRQGVAVPYDDDDDAFDTRHQAEATDTDADAAPPEDPTRMRLLLRDGYEQMPDLEHRLIVVEDDAYTIGREPDNDWQINLPIISPQHCQLVVDETGRITVRDFGSKNGTYVNGERIQQGMEVHVPIGSELWITRDVVVEVYDAFMVIEDVDLALTQTDGQGNSPDELEFKTVPGLGIEADDIKAGQVGQDYSPL